MWCQVDRGVPSIGRVGRLSIVWNQPSPHPTPSVSTGQKIDYEQSLYPLWNSHLKRMCKKATFKWPLILCLDICSHAMTISVVSNDEGHQFTWLHEKLMRQLLLSRNTCTYTSPWRDATRILWGFPDNLLAQSYWSPLNIHYIHKAVSVSMCNINKGYHVKIHL